MKHTSSLLTLSILTLLSSTTNAQSTSELITYPTAIGTRVIGGSTYLIKSASSPEATESGGYRCPLAPVFADDQALEYAFNIQNLLYNYYAAQDLVAASFTSLESEGGNFNAADTAANLQGLRTQADLGRRAINQLGGMTAGFSTPRGGQCNYTYPAGLGGTTSVETFLENAFMVEATLCGAFIGLADYVELPQSASLMARLAAEHGIHAAYLRSFFAAPVVFNASSMSLTPAFTPEMVLSDSPTTYPFTVGYLGQFLSGYCKTTMPSGPCGAEVSFGPLVATLSGGSISSTSVTTPYATATGSIAYGGNPDTFTDSGTGYPEPTYSVDTASVGTGMYYGTEYPAATAIITASTVTMTNTHVVVAGTMATSAYGSGSQTGSAGLATYSGAGSMLHAPGKRLAAAVAAGAEFVNRVVGRE